MSKPLTKRQITVLSIMASKAHKRIQSMGCPLPPLTEWRHQEVWCATGGIESLTKCRQEHYVPIYNRLAAYTGDVPIKGCTYTEMGKALYNLQQAMQRYETSPDYLAEIVRDQLHLPCTGRDVYQALRNFAAVEHVQHLMYTVINRGRTDARKMVGETGHVTYEPHADPRTMPPGKLAGHVSAVRIVTTPGPHKPTERHRSCLEGYFNSLVKRSDGGRREGQGHE